MKYWEIIADNLKKAGWSWGCVSAIDSNGRTIWIADARRGDGKRFIVRADELLTAFLELESGPVRAFSYLLPNFRDPQLALLRYKFCVRHGYAELLYFLAEFLDEGLLILIFATKHELHEAPICRL